MEVIPVIDLLDGQVVHAKMGNRATYQPICSSLTHSSEPLALVASLLALYPFKTLYIADLNAIQNLTNHNKNNLELIDNINNYFKHITMWVDAGIKYPTDLTLWQKPHLKLILGSENFEHLDQFIALKNELDDFILSLDFFSTGYKGPPELLENSTYWPEKVIAMSLSNVGTEKGPNWDLLNKVRSKSTNSKLIAAGGIRDKNDLATLSESNIHAALVATALHNGTISRTDLAKISQ